VSGVLRFINRLLHGVPLMKSVIKKKKNTIWVWGKFLRQIKEKKKRKTKQFGK